jgi:S1-C subfamily serine protease
VSKSVSGPVAVLLIILALLVFAVLFHNPRLAPPESVQPARPPEPEVSDQEVKMMRLGLGPLGITAVLAPLVEDRGKGVRVSSIARNGPADLAGIKVGDRIQKFNGRPVQHPMSLARSLDSVNPGTVPTAEVWRSGKTMTVKIKAITPLPPEERPRP